MKSKARVKVVPFLLVSGIAKTGKHLMEFYAGFIIGKVSEFQSKSDLEHHLLHSSHFYKWGKCGPKKVNLLKITQVEEQIF